MVAVGELAASQQRHSERAEVIRPDRIPRRPRVVLRGRETLNRDAAAPLATGHDSHTGKGG